MKKARNLFVFWALVVVMVAALVVSTAAYIGWDEETSSFPGGSTPQYADINNSGWVQVAGVDAKQTPLGYHNPQISAPVGKDAAGCTHHLVAAIVDHIEVVKTFERGVVDAHTIVGAHPQASVARLPECKAAVATDGTMAVGIALEYAKILAIEAVKAVLGAKPHKALTILGYAVDHILRQSVLHLKTAEEVSLGLHRLRQSYEQREGKECHKSASSHRGMIWE